MAILNEAGEAPTYYFAYGMLTDPDMMSGVTAIGAAELRNFSMEMHRFANVIPSSGSRVFGVLWQLDRKLLRDLDHVEGYPNLYDRKTVPVIAENGRRYEAHVYTMTPSTRKALSGVRPSRAYIKSLINGYRSAGLPLEQIRDTLL